jgi:hypothetical protein
MKESLKEATERLKAISSKELCELIDKHPLSTEQVDQYAFLEKAVIKGCGVPPEMFDEGQKVEVRKRYICSPYGTENQNTVSV